MARPTRFYIDALVGALSKMLIWIDNVREEASAPAVEFAVAAQIIVVGPLASVAKYGEPGSTKIFGTSRVTLIQMTSRLKPSPFSVGG